MSTGKLSRTAAVVLALVALGGCSDTRKALGLEKAPPDEFAVVASAPLTLPPDFGLRPPRDVSARPSQPASQDEAKTVIFRLAEPAKTVAPVAGGSGGEKAFLTAAGADKAEADIRAKVNQETQALIDRPPTFVDKLLFWRDTGPPNEVMDAEAEAQRLHENEALAKPPTAMPPTIERTDRSFLSGLF